MPQRCVWRDGWWSGAAQRASPNFGPRPAGAQVSLVVVHSISLPPGCYRGDAVQRLFANRLDCDAHPYYDQLRDLQVSAHFFVRRSGRTLQFVSCEQRAWHAGTSHWRGRDNCNDWSIGIELEGLETAGFEPAQYRRLARLLQAAPGDLLTVENIALSRASSSVVSGACSNNNAVVGSQSPSQTARRLPLVKGSPPIQQAQQVQLAGGVEPVVAVEPNSPPLPNKQQQHAVGTGFSSEGDSDEE